MLLPVHQGMSNKGSTRFIKLRKRDREKEREMNTTLLIMAAGIGSRFGTGIKQLEPVDDADHIIMDYSIHDAMESWLQPCGIYYP